MAELDIMGSMGRGAAAGDLVREASKRNKLAELYQAQGVGIMNGEQGAINQMAAIDPNAAREQEAAARTSQFAQAGIVAGAIYGSEDPQSFEAAKNTLVQQGLLSPEDAQNYSFDQRDSLIGMVQGIEGQINNERDARDYQTGIQQWGAEFGQRQQQYDTQNQQWQQSYQQNDQQFNQKQASSEYQWLQEFAQDQAATQQKQVADQEAGKVDLSKREQEIRKEFNSIPQVKAFSEQSQAFDRINVSAKNPSAAGDIALIFNFMKMLDPGSVVREGEFATAQNAAGVPEQVRNQFNKLQTGERLGDEQRTDFVTTAQNIYSEAENGFNNIFNQYSEIATQAGLDPSRALIEFGSSSVDGAPQQDFDFSNMTDQQLEAMLAGQ